MATVIAYSQLDMEVDIDFYRSNYGGRSTGVIGSEFQNQYRLFYSDDTYDTLHGTFTYDLYGQADGGTFFDYTRIGYSSKSFTISGVNMSVAAVIAAAMTIETDDDQAVMAAALAGNDIVAGKYGDDTLLGYAGNDYITGSSGNDTLFGQSGGDVCVGQDGNDYINGGEGHDRLAGGSGWDTFVFDTQPNINNWDTLQDFRRAYDDIQLDPAIFRGIESANSVYIKQSAFWKSSTGRAHDADDRVIYETDTGWLNYDSNGNAAGGVSHICMIQNHPNISYLDILVM